MAIYQIFPDCIIIQGATRTPRHQGSVERGNRQIKDMLDAFETYERSNNNPDVQWPSLLPRIMVALNSEPKKTNLGGAFSEVAPYFAVFGQTWNGPFLQHKLDVADMRKYKTAAERVVATRDIVLAERLALLNELSYKDLPMLKQHGVLEYLSDKAKVLIATKEDQLLPEGYNWADMEEKARQNAMGPAHRAILALKKKQDKEMQEFIAKKSAELTWEAAEAKADTFTLEDLDNVS